jgi:hypothetical protein
MADFATMQPAIDDVASEKACRLVFLRRFGDGLLVERPIARRSSASNCRTRARTTALVTAHVQPHQMIVLQAPSEDRPPRAVGAPSIPLSAGGLVRYMPVQSTTRSATASIDGDQPHPAEAKRLVLDLYEQRMGAG